MGDESPLDVQIVPIAEEHIESYHRCLDSVARERLYLAFLEAPPIESTREFVLHNIANDVPQFVAVEDNEVVGWCDVRLSVQEGFTHCGSLGMGVHKNRRRRGIGERLITQTIARARENRLERIELEVLASNVPAIKLYEKVGFEVEGVKKKARKIDGRYDDLVEMALFITDDSSTTPSGVIDMGETTVRKATAGDRAEYLRLRLALYREDDPHLIEKEMDEVLKGDPAKVVAFVLDRSNGKLGGFLEADVRSSEQAGATKLVGYVGSWYVDPDLRRTGVGSVLLRAGESWAREQGCTEMGSDCYATNAVSYRAHLANGYRETHRLIFFSKAL